ncbi:MAG: hypothetical protein M3Y59_08100 [Myxococcota bacterium]|nr:hypothetical protein [Myxococcota bacterium]
MPCRWVEAVGQRMPYAYEGDVIVAAGESFAITGAGRDGLLVDLRPLPDQGAPGPKVTVSWQVRPDGLQVFSVENGFARRLRYRAMRLTPETSEFEDTDSCAVAKLQLDTSATWRSPVKLVALTGLEFVAEETFDACEKRPGHPG